MTISNGALRRLSKAARSRSHTKDDTVITCVVEVFERRAIAGWIDAESGTHAIPVELCINEVPVATTTALPGNERRANGRLLQFNFSLTDLWKYTKRKDRVSVRVSDRPIPIAGKGSFYRPRKDGSSSLAVLQAKLAAGHVFGQSGRLQLAKSLDSAWQADVIGLYHRANKALGESFGISSFVCYGTLLGAIRDKGFIGHDVDFDCAYVSTKDTGREAVEELREVALKLIELGFNVVPKRTCIAISDNLSNGQKIDIYHLYVERSGKLSFPFGIAGNSASGKFAFTGVARGLLADHEVLFPNDPEAMVELIYGASWRHPNPGFKWTRDRTESAREGIVSLERVDELARVNVDAQSDAPSNVLREAAADSIPAVVVEIGSTLGKRAIAMAAAGWRVFALERSITLNRFAEASAEQQDVRGQVEFCTTDITDPDHLVGAIEKVRGDARETPLAFYVRSLVPFSDLALRSTVTALDVCGRTGDYLIAGFEAAPAGRWPKDKSPEPRPVWGLSDLHQLLAESPRWAVEESTSATGIPRLVDGHPMLVARHK